jgi:arylsulfatase A-like enzyme
MEITQLFVAPRRLVSALLLASVAASAAKTPNIVIIYPDDQRWDALSVVQREQGEKARFPWLETPALDRLAASGMRFRNAFVVNSLCSPGRTCVLTGRYSHANGVINNHTPLAANAPTFAKALQQSGYRTAYFGKWHMGNQQERPGFDEYASFIGQGRYFNCPLNVNGVVTPTEGWVDDVTTTRAIEFLGRQSPDKPFLLFLGFKSPHGPRGGENLPERLRKRFAGAESRPVPNLGTPTPFYGRGGKAAAARKNMEPKGNEASTVNGHIEYMRHIAGIDENTGRLLDALDASPHSANTVVIFTSDNGYYLGEHGLGDKRSAYDESMRTPLLIRWPGKIKPSTCDALALNIDLAPTIFELAGLPVPAAIQGRGLRPLLEGATPTDWRTSIFYEYFKERGFKSPTVLATRTEDAKLIHYPGHPEWSELFDLKADPYETRNLYQDPASKALRERLQAEHERLMKTLAFRMPPNVAKDEE